jgi:Flp pilus assembly protein TadD
MNAPTVRRNDPCPCGSGRRFKECHGKLGDEPAAAPNPQQAFHDGMQAFHRGQPETAIARFDAVLAADPQHVSAGHFKGYALCQLGRFDEGMALLRQAVEAQPANPDFQGNIGIIHYVLGELPEAIAALGRAIEIAPATAEPYSNLALALRDSGEFERAHEAAREAVARNPALAVARMNLAVTLLALGRFAEAWSAFNWRPHPGVNLRDPATPNRWPHAAALPPLAADPWITLHGEQGLGDALFFLRFAPALRERGARLRFWGDARLATMLLRSGVVEEASSATQPPGGSDPARLVWVGDLPGMLAIGDAFPQPLRLTPDPARVAAMRQKLAALGPGPHVAITWRAGLPRRGKAVLEKAIDPRALGAALRGRRATFVSVQRDPRPEEFEALRAALDAPLADLSAANADLEDMLALMSQVDDYVGVSNTNMHLRAGTGRGAKVLVPFPPEWRWTAQGEASPWFPRFSLYRAGRDASWDAAMARLGRESRGDPALESGAVPAASRRSHDRR